MSFDLRALRMELSLTREEFSELSDISIHTLAHYEQGNRKISIENAMKIIKTFSLFNIELKLEDIYSVEL